MEKTYKGLSSDEAAYLLLQHGRNELDTKKKISALSLFVNQFKNVLLLLLLGASAISYIVGDLHDAFFIILIIVLNAVLGFIQEYKAENALQSLKKLTISKVRVIRDNAEQMIDSHLLVPGDLVRLEEGDKIPADGRLIESRHLEVNEASLTGESFPVVKNHKDEKINTVFTGTIVSSGTCLMQIIATAYNTKFGELTSSLTTIPEVKTPLEKKILTLGKQLTIGVLIITVCIFTLGIFQSRPFIEMMLTSVSLAVAAVPEGLPAVITIALAVGLQRMAKKKAIIRKLSAVESLGNTTVIVTDKTGTLTENKMRVLDIWVDNTVYKAKNIGSLFSQKHIYELVHAGVMCNNASIVTNDQKIEVIGEQTEGSLMLLAHVSGFPIDKIKGTSPIVEEFSFDQSRKLMSKVIEIESSYVLYTKGAPESVLSRSTKILKENGVHALSNTEKERIQKSFEQFASDGLRILALAKRTLHTNSLKRDEAEKDLIFLGFVGITDPPRDEIKDVLKITEHAGIKTVMVTGDNPLTARAVARHIGLIYDGEAIITGDEVKQLSDEELEQKLDKIRIFARTTPEDKLRIVRLFQKKGEIVTVTGDGVNDALALKQGNTGIAMGTTGTDVAKEVADMVITDDNFVSIVSAISEGRIIFDNIVKSITYLIATNLGEVLLIVYAIVVSFFSNENIPTPLLAVHILWINLVTDGLPALSLAFDKGTTKTMEPRADTNRNQLINRKSILFMIICGITISSISFVVFNATLANFPIETARLFTFNTIMFLQLITIFFIRQDQPLFSNKVLLLSVLLSIVLQIIIIFVPPFPSIFKFV